MITRADAEPARIVPDVQIFRDAIYADYAVALTEKGDPRARDLVDKIENAEMRKR